MAFNLNHFAENHINRLETMGFLRQDCQTALEACKGNLHEAALWLTQHASHASAYYKDNDAGQTQNSSWFALKALEVWSLIFSNLFLVSERCQFFRYLQFNATNICMCLIDDCKDSDVPLIEITLSGRLNTLMGNRKMLKYEVEYKYNFL